MNEIRRKRKSLGLSQARLADILNVARTSVTMWETGKSIPRMPKLFELANVLNCSIYDLYPEICKEDMYK